MIINKLFIVVAIARGWCNDICGKAWIICSNSLWNWCILTKLNYQLQRYLKMRRTFSESNYLSEKVLLSLIILCLCLISYRKSEKPIRTLKTHQTFDFTRTKSYKPVFLHIFACSLEKSLSDTPPLLYMSIINSSMNHSCIINLQPQ